jgi:hypothetical protein
MARIREFTCIIDADVLEWLISRFFKTYPNESAAFLYGDYWNLESRFQVPYISLAREPSDLVTTKNDIDFPHAEVVRQTKLAAAEGAMLMGWAHSHPYKKFFLEAGCQSITDARTQITYRFTISIIVVLWQGGWYCTAWKEGFAAPLDILVSDHKGNLKTLNQWGKRKYKNFKKIS